jgi:hypothetical protein
MKMTTETETRETLSSFIARNRIKVSVRKAERNPNMDDMPRGSTHWAVTIHHDGSRMTVPFSQGSAHTSEPKLADVLDCLASDSSSVDNAGSFEEWCAEYGYDTDSRRAEKTYKACVSQRNKLHRLLGSEAFEALLWNTGRE